MKTTIILSLLIASLLAAACGGATPPAPAQPGQPPATATPVAAPAVEATAAPTDAMPEPGDGAGAVASLSLEALRNATYSGIYDDPVTLIDGLHEGEPFAASDPARPTVDYIDGVELTGDLNGDGVDDAVVFLLERGGGSGAFTYVAAQLNQDGQPVDAGAVRIEDRIGTRRTRLTLCRMASWPKPLRRAASWSEYPRLILTARPGPWRRPATNSRQRLMPR